MSCQDTMGQRGGGGTEQPIARRAPIGEEGANWHELLSDQQEVI